MTELHFAISQCDVFKFPAALFRIVCHIRIASPTCRSCVTNDTNSKWSQCVSLLRQVNIYLIETCFFCYHDVSCIRSCVKVSTIVGTIPVWLSTELEAILVQVHITCKVNTIITIEDVNLLPSISITCHIEDRLAYRVRQVVHVESYNPCALTCDNHCLWSTPAVASIIDCTRSIFATVFLATHDTFVDDIPVAGCIPLATFVELKIVLIFLCGDLELVNTIRHFVHPYRFCLIPSIAINLAEHVVAILVDSRSWGCCNLTCSFTYCVDGNSIA